MILKIIFVIMMIRSSLGQSTDLTNESFLSKLNPLLNTTNEFGFNGPESVSAAPTKSKNTEPSLDTIKYYTIYAAAVYCSQGLETLSCTLCPGFRNDVNVTATKVLRNTDQDTLALITVSYLRKEIVVTFRGTYNTWNVVLDALVFKTNPVYNPTFRFMSDTIRPCYKAVMSLYDQVVTNVKDQLDIHPDYKIVLTGHSLGGCMSRIFVFLLQYFEVFPGATYEVYTYGETRSGNQEYVDFLNEQNITTGRAVHKADIFPHVPPTSLLKTKLLGDYYYHALTEIWINDQNVTFCDQSVYEDPNCSNSLAPLYSVFDHEIYFDVNFLTCVNQPANFELPASILQPAPVLPPLPTPIPDITGNISTSLPGLVSPIGL